MELVVWEVVFFAVPVEIVYSFNCNFLFDIFRNGINLAAVPKLGYKDLVYDYLFTSQTELDEL